MSEIKDIKEGGQMTPEEQAVKNFLDSSLGMMSTVFTGMFNEVYKNVFALTKVRIKRLTTNAQIPSYAHSTDAGLDLVATSCKYNEEKEYFVYDTGIIVEIPVGYVGLVFPRSSIRDTDAYMCNHVGVIDSGYRGEITASFKNHNKNNTKPPYEVGDRIAQMIIMPYPKVLFEEVETIEELSNTDRGTGGHGSTGK